MCVVGYGLANLARLPHQGVKAVAPLHVLVAPLEVLHERNLQFQQSSLVQIVFEFFLAFELLVDRVVCQEVLDAVFPVVHAGDQVTKVIKVFECHLQCVAFF